MSTTDHQFDDFCGGFSVNSQRPPVPGEENDQLQKASSSACDKSLQFSGKGISEVTFSSASGIPRRLTNELSSKIYPDTYGIALKLDRCDSSDAPLGFEPEGSTALSATFQESSSSSGTPSCSKWAENFNYLLQDSDGINLFKRFLYDKEKTCDTVDFWFACSGLKMVAPTEVDHITSLVKLIFKKYIKGNNLKLDPDVRRRITERLKRDQIDQTIFNEAQVEVENVMRNDMYPLFLKSEIYLQFVQSGGDSPKPMSRESGSSEALFSGSGVGKLPTLHEEDEQKSETSHDNEHESQLYYITQGTPKPRDRITPERFCVIPYPGFRQRVSNPYHITYAPVSAQDSELQSLSSEALTDDTMSYTDSSVDGREYAVHRNRMALRKQEKVMKRNADTNQTAGLDQHFIPRTQIVKPDCNMSEKDPMRFASLLTERLLKVKEEQDKHERFLSSIKSIQETDDEGNPSTSQCRSGFPKYTPFNNAVGSFTITSLFASAMANSDHEDNAQSILDDHVSHIWNSTGVTPSRSPGRLTPDHQRRDLGLAHTSSSAVSKRLKDTVMEQPSAFTSCGKEGKFVHPVTGKIQQHSGKDHHTFSSRELELSAQLRRHLAASSPSSSNPVQSKIALVHPTRPNAEDLRHLGVRQNADAGDRAEAVATDRHILPPSETTKERVMMWMLDNEKYCETRTHCSTDCSDKGSSNKRSSHKSAGKKGSSHNKTNRSESLDRNKLGSLPPSDTAPCPPRAPTQSNSTDVKRPVNDDLKSSSNKTSWPSKSKGVCEPSDAKKQEGTVVGYYFCDEPIPYRTTIPGRNVTLGQLKQLIAKKGAYKFFFKKVCHDFESGVVHEEITQDDDVLPLWDGKVVCKIERLP